MTNPGEIEKVPLKVVPIYIEMPEAIEADEAPDVTPEPETETPAPATPLLGRLAFGAALVTTALLIMSVAVASAGAWATGTALGYTAIGFSVLAVGVGIAAIILNRGRGWGIAAIVLGIIANPWLLLGILGAFSALQV